MDYIEIKKKIDRRNLIGWIVFIVLATLEYNEYISFTLVFMIALPMVSYIIFTNSIDDDIQENNKIRLTLLAILLALVGFTSYRGHMNNDIANNRAIAYCYAHSKDTNMCGEIDNILNPSSDEYYYDE